MSAQFVRRAVMRVVPSKKKAPEPPNYHHGQQGVEGLEDVSARAFRDHRQATFVFVKEMSIEMRNLFVLTGASLLFCTTAGAWNYPQWEAFAGYNFVRYNPDSAFVIPSFNANGGNGQIAYNFNKWFAGVIDTGAATKGSLN